VIDSANSTRLLSTLVALVYLLVSFGPPSRRRTVSIVAAGATIVPILAIAVWPGLLQASSISIEPDTSRIGLVAGAIAVVLRYAGGRAAGRLKTGRLVAFVVSGVLFLVFAAMTTTNWIVILASAVCVAVLLSDSWLRDVTAEASPNGQSQPRPGQ
jgi:peptidoglycan/LPS O-acetylase OafA/YrhL